MWNEFFFSAPQLKRDPLGGGVVMVTFRAAAFGFVMLLVFACASNRAVIFVAPSNETVVSGTEMALSGEGQVVFVYNHSSVSIVVTGLHLIDCENIKNRCEVQHIRIPVPAGQRTDLVTVRPDAIGRAYSFRFTYSWEQARQQ